MDTTFNVNSDNFSNNNMKKELTKPGGLFLVTNPNGTPNGQK